jgi:hypothetical protein
MKKGILLVFGIFLMVSTVEAKNGHTLPNNIRVNYMYENAVNFIERGVEFFIFTNGEFDFNINNNYYDYNGQRNRVQHRTISRDYSGRIISIGNSFVNYDWRGNVTRIGNISMRYYSGRLTHVGNLNVRYDRGGFPNFYGYVSNNYHYDNGLRVNLNIGTVCAYNDTYFYRSDFGKNYSQIREDNNFYYYRARPNANIGKRSNVLKRRKHVSKRRVNNAIQRKNSTSYRRSSETNNNQKGSIDRNNNNASSRKFPSKSKNRKVIVNKRKSRKLHRNSTRTNSKRETSLDRRSTANSTRKATTINKSKPSSRKTLKKVEKTTRKRRNS